MSKSISLPVLTIDREKCIGTVSNFECFEKEFHRVAVLDLLQDWIYELDYLIEKDGELYRSGSSDTFVYPENSLSIGNAKLTLRADCILIEGTIGREEVFFENVHPEIRRKLLLTWHNELEYRYNKILYSSHRSGFSWKRYEMLKSKVTLSI